MAVLRAYTLIYLDSLAEPPTEQRYEGDDLGYLLLTHVKRWDAEHALYKNHVSPQNRVPLANAFEFDQLKHLPSGVYVAQRAAGLGPLAIGLILFGVFVGLLGVAYLLQPKIPTLSDQDRENTSDNNSLSNRRNTARPLERIPDLYGRAFVLPDLIATSYRIFLNGVETEFGIYCAGRGELVVHGAYDGARPISSIDGSAVAVYAPFTYPQFNQEPQYFEGDCRTTPSSDMLDFLYFFRKYDGLSGSSLPRPSPAYNTRRNFTFYSDGRILLNREPSDVDPRVYGLNVKFTAGDTITLQADGSTFEGREAQRLPVILSIEWTGANQIAITFQAQLGFESLLADVDVGTAVQFREASLLNALPTVYALNLGGYYVVSAKPSAGTIVCSYSRSSPSSGFASVIAATGGTVRSLPLNMAALALSGEPIVNRGLVIETFMQRFDGVGPTFNLDGEYTLTEASVLNMWVQAPEKINPNWKLLTNLTEIECQQDYTVILKPSPWLGWVEIAPIEVNRLFGGQIFVNLVAPQGVYAQNGSGTRFEHSVALAVEFVLREADGVTDTIFGRRVDTFFYGGPAGTPNTGITVSLDTTFVGSVPSDARLFLRLARGSTTQEGITFVDEIQVREVYVGRSPSNLDWERLGDVTTVLSRVALTPSSATVENRALTLDATRVVRYPEADGTMTTEPATRLPEILAGMAADPFIGRGSVSGTGATGPNLVDWQIGMTGIGLLNQVDLTFGYVFDDARVSFEEMVNTLTTAYFGRAYRVGRDLRVQYNTRDQLPTLALTHRNTLVESYSKTLTLGTEQRFDGVELTYRDASDFDAPKTIFLPSDRSSTNPQKIELAGVRNEEWAMVHAKRLFNKQVYQRVAAEVIVLEEGALLAPDSLVLLANLNAADYQDGEIVEIMPSGTQFRLSQPVPESFVGMDLALQLQKPEGGIESLEVTDTDGDIVVTATPPSFAVNVDASVGLVTSYVLTTTVGEYEPRLYRVIEKEESDNQLWNVKLVLDDQRIYQDDPTYPSEE